MTTTQQPTLVHVTELVEGERVTLNLDARFSDMSPEAIARRLYGSGRTFAGLTDERGGAFAIQYRNTLGSRIATTAARYTHAWVLRSEQPEGEPTEGEANTERPASEQWAGADASARVSSILRGVTLNPAEAEALVDIVRSRSVGDVHVHHSEAYDQGVRDGYAKAVVPEFERRPLDREQAVVLAVQAIGGTEHALSVVDFARQIEAYVNESTEQVEAKADDSPLVPDTEFPSVIRTAADTELDWPVGTEVGPDYEGSMWRMTDDGWRWVNAVTLMPVVGSSLQIADFLRGGLPVIRLGADA